MKKGERRQNIQKERERERDKYPSGDWEEAREYVMRRKC